MRLSDFAATEGASNEVRVLNSVRYLKTVVTATTVILGTLLISYLVLLRNSTALAERDFANRMEQYAESENWHVGDEEAIAKLRNSVRYRALVNGSTAIIATLPIFIFLSLAIQQIRCSLARKNSLQLLAALRYIRYCIIVVVMEIGFLLLAAVSITAVDLFHLLR